MTSLEVECFLNRENNTVSIVLHAIPLESLERVLRDAATETWRTNVIAGIQDQCAARPGTDFIQRNFSADAEEQS